ncbi:MAG: hypothetical protein QNJ77_02595 [Acidimicrobiia bacterium]|nr:hypothetical protein [Acidimicrobiia bacterium]
MLYRAAFDFRVTRRIEWADDLAAFHGHIEQVRQRIADRKITDDVRVMADIGESTLTLDFLIEGQDESSAEMEALAVVSLAIRECGARHVGLYPIVEERRLRSRVNAFSGLRTPRWEPRRILIAAA